MLSEATVRLHRKHSGLFTAFSIYLLLMAFNGSRFIYWALVGAFSQTTRAQNRRRHFKGVSSSFIKAWPKVGRAFQ